jgi:hypothetical protein
VTYTVEDRSPERGAEAEAPPARRRSRITALVVVVAMALIVGVGAEWWVRGGTFLDANGAGYSGVAAPNQLFSVGIDLETHAGTGVTLDRVSATEDPAGAQVTWSIYKNSANHEGFGSWLGALRPRWPTVAVHGDRVAQPASRSDRGETWLVASMRSSRPGVYHLTNITVTYHSGPRTRHTAANSDVCILVYPRAQRLRIEQQVDTFKPNETSLDAVDPLVAEYERCSDATLLQ